MKVYKSEPNQYGWYWKINTFKNKDTIRIWRKCTKPSWKKFERVMDIYGDGIKLLKRVLEEEK